MLIVLEFYLCFGDYFFYINKIILLQTFLLSNCYYLQIKTEHFNADINVVKVFITIISFSKITVDLIMFCFIKIVNLK